jgi:hypothetical protein
METLGSILSMERKRGEWGREEEGKRNMGWGRESRKREREREREREQAS